MSGRFILDTNAVIALFRGNTTLIQTLKSANWIGISIITELEFLSFLNISENDTRLFNEFKENVEIVDLRTSDFELMETIITFRSKYKIKLPDAIIAATSLVQNSTLMSNDQIFSKIPNIEALMF